jgi:hypothetical protein
VQHEVEFTVKVSVIDMQTFSPKIHGAILIFVVKSKNASSVHQICPLSNISKIHRVEVLFELSLVLTNQNLSRFL